MFNTGCTFVLDMTSLSCVNPIGKQIILTVCNNFPSPLYSFMLQF